MKDRAFEDLAEVWSEEKYREAVDRGAALKSRIETRVEEIAITRRWYRSLASETLYRFKYVPPGLERLTRAAGAAGIPQWLIEDAAAALAELRPCPLEEARERLAFNLERLAAWSALEARQTITADDIQRTHELAARFNWQVVPVASAEVLEFVESEIEQPGYSVLRAVLALHRGVSARIVKEEIAQLIQRYLVCRSR